MLFTNKSIVAGVAALFLGSSLFVAGAARADDDKKPAAKPAAESTSEEADKPDSEGKSKPEGKPKSPAKDDGAKEDKGGAEKVEDKNVRVTKPWSELTLTEDQKLKIKAIHGKALAEINAIEKQERTDIEALLDDAQKTELAGLKTKGKKEAAEKRTEKKGKEKPAEEKAAE